MPDAVQKNVASIFDKAPFLAHLGIELTGCGEGWCEARLSVRPEHLQQHGYAHAGVVTTLADHCAGGAARTMTGERDVVTLSFNINFVRPAVAKELVCRAEVIKVGKNVAVAEASVFDVTSDGRRLVAKLTETLMVKG